MAIYELLSIYITRYSLSFNPYLIHSWNNTKNAALHVDTFLQLKLYNNLLSSKIIVADKERTKILPKLRVQETMTNNKGSTVSIPSNPSQQSHYGSLWRLS